LPAQGHGPGRRSAFGPPARRHERRPRVQLHRQLPTLAAGPRGAVRHRAGRVRPAPWCPGRRAAAWMSARGDGDRHGGRCRVRTRAWWFCHPQLHRRRTECVMGSELLERRAVISGVGQSTVGRQIARSGFQLTLDAILDAVGDAGLTLDDIDGLAMYPGGGKSNVPGYSTANLYEVQDALRIATTWRQGLVEGMSLPFYGPAQA